MLLWVWDGYRDLTPCVLELHRGFWPQGPRSTPCPSSLPGCTAPLAAAQSQIHGCPALLCQDSRGRTQHRARRPSPLRVAATALSRHATHVLLAAKRHRAPSSPAPPARAADTHKGNPQQQLEPFGGRGTARIVFLCTQSNLGKQEAHKGD